jgi:hypothetical protein
MSRFICTLVLAAMLSLGAAAQQPVYRFTQGKPYKYVVENTVTMVQEAGGESNTISVDGTSSFILTPDKTLEGGDLHIAVKIESAVLLIESGEGSQSLGDDLTGKEFGFKMKPNGDAYEPDTTIKLLGGQGVRVAMQVMDLFPTMEAENLQVGKSWETTRNDTTDVGDNKIVKTETAKYTVKGKATIKNRECLEIAYSKEAETNGKMSQMGRDLSVSGSEMESGTIAYDPAEGVLVQVTNTSNGEQHIIDLNSSMKVDISNSATGKTEYISE